MAATENKTAAGGGGTGSLVSVVLSFRNEEAVLPELIRRLQETLGPLPVRYELIFVNDTSTDRSLEILREARHADPRIKIMNMSRRWGVSECTLAGIAYARGDAVIMMDADLQDPPELLPTLIEKWQQGADVVNTVRLARAGESRLKVFLTGCAYRLIRLISNVDLPRECGDFKLMSRRVVNEVVKLQHEKDPYLRGLVRWIGFTQVELTYERHPRAGGETHYSILRTSNPWRTLMSGITSFSNVPLYLLPAVGLLICAAALVVLVAAVARLAMGCSAVSPFGLILFTMLIVAVNSCALGIMAVYIGRIYNEVRSRPNYIVESFEGFDEA